MKPSTIGTDAIIPKRTISRPSRPSGSRALLAPPKRWRARTVPQSNITTLAAASTANMPVMPPPRRRTTTVATADAVVVVRTTIPFCRHRWAPSSSEPGTLCSTPANTTTAPRAQAARGVAPAAATATRTPAPTTAATSSILHDQTTSERSFPGSPRPINSPTYRGTAAENPALQNVTVVRTMKAM